MKSVQRQPDLDFVMTLCAAAALLAAGSSTVGAQVLPAFPGISDSGGCGNSCGGVPSSPNACIPYYECIPHSPWWPMRTRFGDTAISTARSSMFNMNDNSFVQMPQMIQVPRTEAWVPSAERTVARTPKIEAPHRPATGSVVRGPLTVRIVPKVVQTDLKPARSVSQPPASKASR